MQSSEQAEPSPVASRRRALRDLGIGVGVLTIGSALVPVRSLMAAAGAQESEGEDAEAPTEEGAPSEADQLAFLESVERAAAGIYRDVAASGLIGAANLATVNAFGQHHSEHATKLATLAGSASVGRPNPKLATILADQLTQATDEKAALRILADLESGLASSHLTALGTLGTPPAKDVKDAPPTVPGAAVAVAAILPVEGQHAAVLGGALGRSAAERLPAFEIVDNAMPADAFPATEKKEAAS